MKIEGDLWVPKVKTKIKLAKIEHATKNKDCLCMSCGSKNLAVFVAVRYMAFI